MRPNERLEYRGMGGGPAARFPGDTRLVVWPIVNVESWDIAGPMPRTVLPPPFGGGLLPDIANWGWHEYGARRGFWRLKQALDELGIVPTLSLNGVVCEAYPEIAGACRDAGWEFMGHAYVQGPTHKLDDQAGAIRQTIDAIRDFTGTPPIGWLSPGLTETYETIDLLADAGIEYVGDWVVDDLPVDLKTKSGAPMTALPYSLEINDIPVILVQNHAMSEFVQRTIDQFERLYAEAEHEARILSIAVHPYVSGVPHRIAYFEGILKALAEKPGVEFWTGEKIYHWHRSLAGV